MIKSLLSKLLNPDDIISLVLKLVDNSVKDPKAHATYVEDLKKVARKITDLYGA